jgi:dTDP-4-dehydrorhamnose 3,5-epimerase-like enzyme
MRLNKKLQMNVIETDIKGVVIEPKVFADERGYFLILF